MTSTAATPGLARHRILGRARWGAMVGAVALVALALPAFADAPDPVLPLSGSVRINTDGTKTLTVEGGWAWSTHHSDCNTDRYAAGWALDWNDPGQPGNYLATVNGQSVEVGAKDPNALNPADNATHFYTTTPRCGTYSSSLGYNTGRWGPMSHTYAATVSEFNVCTVMYDIHTGSNGGPKATDLIAGGPNHADDNSVEKNGSTPLGNGCFLFKIPSLTTQASATMVRGGAINDTATLSNGSTDISGTLTFKAYGPDDANCTGAPVFTTTKAVSGNGSYTSASFTPTTAGVYRWVASYGGNAKNAATTGACNDANESTTVTSPPPPPPPPPPVKIDLGVTKSDSPDPIVLGTGNVTYTLTITNNGPDDATGVVVVDTLPASLHFVSATGCSAAGQTVTCAIGNLANGATATRTVVVKPTAVGTFTNVAVVSGDQQETTLANNRAEEPTTVTALPAAPVIDLGITKADDIDPILLGSGNVTYTLTVKNFGPSPATGVVATDTLPASMTFVSAAGCTAAGQTITCPIGNLAVGDTAVRTIVVTPTISGRFTNVALVSGTQTDSNPSNNRAEEPTTVTVPTTTPDLAITKSDGGSVFSVGRNGTYTLTVTNVGGVATTGPVTVTDVLAASLTFVSATGTGWNCTDSGSTVTCAFGGGPLASGASAPPITVTVGVLAAALPRVVNTGVVKTRGDLNPANDTSTVTTPVVQVLGEVLTQPAPPAAPAALVAPAATPPATRPAVAASPLARTGLVLGPLAGLGLGLCLIGSLLSTGRRRRSGEFISISDRLAGF